MPSPTESTWPTSLTSASAPKFWISRFRIAEISAGWISMMLLPSFVPSFRSPRTILSVAAHCAAHAVQLGAQRGIDHARTHLHDEAAEQRGIDVSLDQGIALELVFEDALQLL